MPPDISRRLDEIDNKVTAIGDAIRNSPKQVQYAVPASGKMTPDEVFLSQYSPNVQDKGIATSGDVISLTDVMKSWATNAWRGVLLTVLIGGRKYVKTVSSNTADTLFFDTLPGNIQALAGTPYVIGASSAPGSKITTKVIDLALIAVAPAISTIAQCAVVDLSGRPLTMAITIEATYNAIATQGIRIHVVSSYNNIAYDTIDWDTWNPSFTAGAIIRQTKNYGVNPYGIKILVENLDPAQTVTVVRVYVTVGS